MLIALASSCPDLRELEINGRSHGNYDPDLLMRFRNLEGISIFKPDLSVVGRLESWFAVNKQTLRSLSFIGMVHHDSALSCLHHSHDNIGRISDK